MEFNRFGSSIPGRYWGCCAMDIIQNFKIDPDTPWSMEMTSGDGGGPVLSEGKQQFAGPTLKDIFHQRLRCGTFGTRDMPNHGFLAILTEQQLAGEIGKKWLKILSEAGFEFVRTVVNSVYTGAVVGSAPPKGVGSNKNYLFALFRNIGAMGAEDQFTPPKAWSDLGGKVGPKLSEKDAKKLTAEHFEIDKAVWDRIGAPKFLTEEEVVAAKAPVVLAGTRCYAPNQPDASYTNFLGFPPQEKSIREKSKAVEAASKPAPSSPLKGVTAPAPALAGVDVLSDPSPT